MKNSIRKSYFNIVEVALAMAIIGLGMTSIMALFPIGINASRSAVGNTAATEVAEKFMGYIKSYAEKNSTNYGNIKGVGTLTDITNFKTGTLDKKLTKDDITCQFLTDLKSDSFGVGEQYSTLPNWANLYKNTTHNYLYIAIQRRDDTSTEPDFSAAILLWKSYVNSSGAGNKLGLSGRTTLTWPAADADGEIFILNAEVSWPLSKVYKDREKRYFQTIIVNPSN